MSYFEAARAAAAASGDRAAEDRRLPVTLVAPLGLRLELGSENIGERSGNGAAPGPSALSLFDWAKREVAAGDATDGEAGVLDVRLLRLLPSGRVVRRVEGEGIGVLDADMDVEADAMAESRSS